jgi:hypothetical protein
MYRNAMLHIFLLVSYILNHPNFWIQNGLWNTQISRPTSCTMFLHLSYNTPTCFCHITCN